MTDIPSGKKLILFDGVCNLCNTAITKVIHFDRQNIFLFASLQSEVAQNMINDLGIDSSKIDSIILYDPKVSYDIKSTAALKIMKAFGGVWILTQLFWIFPRGVRDKVYDVIAKNRYKWFGKTSHCMIPTPELKSKFL